MGFQNFNRDRAKPCVLRLSQDILNLLLGAEESVGQTNVLSAPITSLGLVLLLQALCCLASVPYIGYNASYLKKIEKQALHLSLGMVILCLFGLVTGYAFQSTASLIPDSPNPLCTQRSSKYHRGKPDVLQQLMIIHKHCDCL